MRPLACGLLLMAACRFGGDDGDALALVGPPPEADVGPLDAAMETLDSAHEPAPVDAAEPLDAAVESDSALDASSLDATPSTDAAPGRSCSPPAVATCDPVRNTGCTPGVTHCVIDPDVVGPAGRCVFSGLALDPCSESLLTSCVAQHTCLGGQCRKVCYCDADCAPGSSCSEPRPGATDTTIMLCAAAPVRAR